MPLDGRIEKNGGECPGCGHIWPKPIKIITGTPFSWLIPGRCEICRTELVLLSQPGADKYIQDALKEPHKLVCGPCALGLTDGPTHAKPEQKNQARARNTAGVE